MAKSTLHVEAARRLTLPQAVIDTLRDGALRNGTWRTQKWDTRAAIKARPMHAYNPSIIAAPEGLCPTCAYIVSLRASTLHQCDSKGLDGASATHIAGTVILALDSSFETLASTVLLNNLEAQLTRDGGFMGGHRVHDVRLFRHDQRPANEQGPVDPGSRTILATWHCHRCPFLIALVHLSARRSAATRELELRAWSSKWEKTQELKHPALQGRNQALFAGKSRARGQGSAGHGPVNVREKTPPLMVQSWLPIVAELGTLHMAARRVMSLDLARRAALPAWLPRDRVAGVPGAWMKITSISLSARALSVHNLSADTAWSTLPRRVHFADEAARGATMSPTAHLLHVATRQPPVATDTPTGRVGRSMHGDDDALRSTSMCEAFLGVGHFHRRAGLGNHHRRAAAGLESRRRRAHRRRRSGPMPGSLPTSLPGAPLPPFRWGYDYAHFWYTLDPRPPHRLLGASADFCLVGVAGGQCELVQYLSGVAPLVRDAVLPRDSMPRARARAQSNDGEEPCLLRKGCDSAQTPKGAPQVNRPADLVLTYGINDCEARLARLSMEHVWAALQPLPGSNGSTCRWSTGATD